VPQAMSFCDNSKCVHRAPFPVHTDERVSNPKVIFREANRVVMKRGPFVRFDRMREWDLNPVEIKVL